MKEGNNLKGDVVLHGSGVYDLFYGSPDLTGYVVDEHSYEKESSGTVKVQLKLKHPVTNKEYSLLMIASN